MTSRKNLAPDPGTRDSWKATAAALGARLKRPDRTARALTAWIAQSAWRRMYYAEQPSMINPEHDLDFPVDDLLDALRLMPAVRYSVDCDERDLIRIARHKGATWEQIGVALGAAESGARQTARGRYARLGGNVTAAVPGDAVEQAPALVDGGPRVEAPPADDWLLPGEDRGYVRAVAFVAPPLIDIDDIGPGDRSR